MANPLRQLIRNRDSVIEDYERMRETLGDAVRIAKPEDFLTGRAASPRGDVPDPLEGLDLESAWEELVRITHPFHL